MSLAFPRRSGTLPNGVCRSACRPPLDSWRFVMATVDEETVVAEPRIAAEVRREPEVNKLFRSVMENDASDLHLKVGCPRLWGLRGSFPRLKGRQILRGQMKGLWMPVLTRLSSKT